MSANIHRGPWADESRSAIAAALAEVNVDSAEYVECTFTEGSRLEPLDPARPAVWIEVEWSEPQAAVQSHSP